MMMEESQDSHGHDHHGDCQHDHHGHSHDHGHHGHDGHCPGTVTEQLKDASSESSPRPSPGEI